MEEDEKGWNVRRTEQLSKRSNVVQRPFEINFADVKVSKAEGAKRIAVYGLITVQSLLLFSTAYGAC